MSDLTYGQIEAELLDFAEDDLAAAPGGAARLINRALRYIRDFYQGEWEHLLVHELSRTIDATGYLITLPSDFNKLKYVFQFTRQRGREFEKTDFYMDRESPADLTDAVLRQIHYWKQKTSGGVRYITYWRTFKEFAGTSAEFVDMPNSSETILDVGKWFIARSERNRDRGEIKDLKDEAVLSIRRLKVQDVSVAADHNAVAPSNDMETVVYPTYDLNDGGASVLPWNPNTEGLN
ncbi:MAG: hypothetical protein WC716_16695 [Chitinophagaceae bacterium]|jgi:hypothetical protein